MPVDLVVQLDLKGVKYSRWQWGYRVLVPQGAKAFGAEVFDNRTHRQAGAFLLVPREDAFKLCVGVGGDVRRMSDRDYDPKVGYHIFVVLHPELPQLDPRISWYFFLI